MSDCPGQSWFSYYKENMEGLHASITDTIDGTAKMVLGDITVLLGYVDKYGVNVTVKELAGAGTKMDFAKTVGAGISAIYLGAMIGSAAVATGRYGACGSYIIDAFAFARMHGFDRPWVMRHLQRYPEIYTPNHPARAMYARLSLGAFA